MRRLTPADYRRMPWRNGGGATTEIVIAPEGASVSGERFLYRVSIADVAGDGMLVGGAVRDLNLMVDRARATSALEVERFEAPRSFACGAGCMCVVHVIEGALDGAAEGDTLVAGAPFELVPMTKARVAIARIGLLP